MRGNGNKARLIFSDESGIHINVAVRWQKIDSREVDDQMIVIAKNNNKEEVRFRTLIVAGEDVGTPVENSNEDFLVESVQAFKRRKGWLNAEGQESDKSEVKYFQVHPDGHEAVVEKFSKSKELEVIALKPMEELENWKVEDCYTIWADEVKERGRIKRDEYSLYQLAKLLTERNQFAAVKFSTGNSFNQFYGLIYPHYEDQKFVLKMKSARAKIIWGENTRGLMEIVEQVPVAQEDPNKAKPALAEL